MMSGGTGRKNAGLDFDSDINDSEDYKSEDEMRRVIDDSDSESPSPKKKDDGRKVVNKKAKKDGTVKLNMA